MAVLFIISVFLLITSFMLFPINYRQNNIVFCLLVNIVLAFLVNAFVVFVFSWFNLTCGLFPRSIIYLIISFLIFYYIKKKNHSQMYYCRISDIMILIFSISCMLYIGNYRFGKNMDLYFDTTDPAVHYVAATRFAETSRLSEINHNEYLFYPATSESTMFLSYISLGTLFQVNNSLGGDMVSNVGIFLWFELFVLMFTSLSVFYIFSLYPGKIGFSKLLFSFALVGLCIMGYPFNNLIFGFHYLGLSILLILISIILLHNILDKDNNSNFGYKIVTMLFLFNVFTSYYLFAPVIFGAGGLFILYELVIRKNVSIKCAFKTIGEILVVPFAFGIFYYFIRNRLISTGGLSSSDVFKMEGYIYRNLFGNFVILFIPIVFRIISNMKKKCLDVLDFSVILTAIYILLLFIFLYRGNIGSYYYYKLYYLLWPISFACLGRLMNENILLSKTIIILLLSLFLYEFKEYDNYLSQKNPLINNTPLGSSITNVYWFNKLKTKSIYVSPIFTKDELKSMNKLIKNTKFDDGATVYVDDLLQKLWFYDFANVNPNGLKNYLGAFYEDNLSKEEIYTENAIRYVVHKKDAAEDFSNWYFKKIYSNNHYVLFERIRDYKEELVME